MATVVDSASGSDPAWPVKQRELVQFVIDSRPWNDFVLRDDDIVISTWSKSGTTWMQQIVGQLILGAVADTYCPDHSPWIEFRLREGEAERAAGQTHRRFLKSHLPIDAIVYSPKAKYIFVGRDARDTYWSWHNHHMAFNAEVLDFISSLYPDQSPIGYPNADVRLAFLDWLDRNAYPNWPFWSHVQGWYDARNLPNLRLVHFADLKGDLPGQITAIADFLEIPIDPAKWPDILEHCSFDYMRMLAVRKDDMRRIFKSGGSDFINKGTNGRWRDVLTAEDLARFHETVAANLTPDCAHWLETANCLQARHRSRIDASSRNIGLSLHNPRSNRFRQNESLILPHHQQGQDTQDVVERDRPETYGNGQGHPRRR